MDAIAEIRATFFEECAEQLAELESGLLAMEGGQTDSETVNAVFRAVHSIKGGAGAFNLDDLVQFAHVFETTLDHVRSGKLDPDPAVVRTLLRSADVLTDLVAAARDERAGDAERTQAMAAEVAALIGAAPAPVAMAEAAVCQAQGEGEGEEDAFEFVPIAVDLGDLFASVPEPVNAWVVDFAPRAELYQKANESGRLLRELRALGEAVVICDTSRVPMLDALEPEESYLSWRIELSGPQDTAGINEIFEFVDEDCRLEVSPLNGAEGGEASGDDAAGSAAPMDLAALLASVRGDVAPAGEAGDAEAPEAVTPAMPASFAISTEEPTAAASSPEARRMPASGSASASAPTVAAPTIRVDLERVDRLIDLVGELVIHQVMLSQRVTQAGLARASEVAIGLEELEQLTRQLQDSVMAIRAQPVKSVFQKLPRLVREVADRTGKSVRLVTEGESTEVDKTVIERLSDPLTHMIRNAIDHGLETPEARLAAGKPEEGVVRVAAMHRSGRIVIEISDDGAGINRRNVFNIAVAKGLVPADANLSDDELDNLIFLPGFSTKTEVSELSGRGVGMDVVKRSIQALGGRVSIASKPGEGSMFTMSLPLTLAVLDGMIVSCGEQTLVVPLTAIIETLRPKAAEIKPFGDGSRVINVRDQFLPLVDVGHDLAYRAHPGDPMTGVVILVETEKGQRSALLVDAIQGQRQVVIKSLEANYGHVPGIAAATILGDGRVALILDVDVVAAPSRHDNGTAGPVLRAAE